MHRWNCSRFTYDGRAWHEESVSTLAAYREGARIWAALDVFRCAKDEVVVRYGGTVSTRPNWRNQHGGRWVYPAEAVTA